MKNIDGILVSPDATIRDAMVRINTSGVEIALVVDPSRRLVGTVTDGDIRRALLAGASLSDRVEACLHGRPTTVDPSAGRADVLDLMRSRLLRQIPIVDVQGRVTGLHLLNEIIGAIQRPNWAILVAGGRGTRLQPLTDSVPKPMLQVAGRPILERLVLHLVGFGISRIFIAVHHLQEIISNHFGDGAAFGCTIEYVREEQPLGTAGCLGLLPERPEHPTLVMNADLVTQFDVGRMLAWHEAGGFAATMGVRTHQVKIPFGVVDVLGGRVTGILEKPEFRWAVSAGIYVLSPEVMSGVERGVSASMPEVLLSWVQAGRPVGAYALEEDWIDVGVPQELYRARGQPG